MFGGFGNNGTLALATYEPELQEMIRVARDKGYQLPSKLNLDAINQCMRELKLASITGDLRGYSTIRVYGNDLVWSGNRTGDIGFTGMWWNRPEISVNVINSANKSLLSIGNVINTARVNTGYNPLNDTTVSDNDLFHLWHFEEEQAVTNGLQGINGTTNRLLLTRSATLRVITIGNRSLVLNSAPTGRNTYQLTALPSNGGFQFFHNNQFITSGAFATWVKSNTIFEDLSDAAIGRDINLSACITAPRSTINRDLVYNAIINYFNRLRKLPPNTLISIL